MPAPEREDEKFHLGSSTPPPVPGRESHEIHSPRASGPLGTDRSPPTSEDGSADTFSEEASPRRDVQRPRRRGRAPVTMAIILANVIVYGLQARSPAIEQLGAQFQISVWDGEYWRILTATFLHGFFGHIALNMLGVYLFGIRLEPRLGRARFLTLYLASALGGGFAFQAFSSGLGVGASGALYGLVGALLVAMFGYVRNGRLRVRGRYFLIVPTILIADHFITGALIRSFAGDEVRIATSAHLGGFVTGSVLGFLAFARAIPSVRPVRAAATVAVWAAFVLFGTYSVFPVHHPVWREWRPLRAALHRGDADLESVRRLVDVTEVPEYVEYFVRDSLYRAIRARKELRDALAENAAPEEVEALEGTVERMLDQAIRIWDAFGSTAKAEVGFVLHDMLRAVRFETRAAKVRATIVEIYRHRYEAGKKAQAQWLARAHDANNLAWFMAMDDDELVTAERIATEALRLVRGRRPEFWESFGGSIDPAELEGIVLNTLGWIQFRLGADEEEAIANLTRAAELFPAGANLLYLAIAHQQLRNIDEALEAARAASSDATSMTEYERVLLERLQIELGID